MIVEKINDRYRELCSQLGDLEYSKSLETRRFDEKIRVVVDEIDAINKTMPLIHSMETRQTPEVVTQGCSHQYRKGEDGSEKECLFCGEAPDSLSVGAA